MPELRLTCLSPEARDLVLSEMHHIKGEKAREVFTRLVNQVTECPVGQEIGVEMAQAGKGGKAKRAPSAYNVYVGSCMKQGKNMKQCSADWKAGKR